MGAFIIFFKDYLFPVSLLIIGAILAAVSALDAYRDGSKRASTLALASAVVNAISGWLFFAQLSA